MISFVHEILIITFRDEIVMITLLKRMMIIIILNGIVISLVNMMAMVTPLHHGHSPEWDDDPSFEKMFTYAKNGDDDHHHDHL